MENKINVFLNNGSGSGSGSGDGFWYWSGSGSGSGDGSGSGAGYGSGSGDGCRSGSGSGDGSGAGSWDGSGYGSGAGDGSWSGAGHKLNNKKIYKIDNVNAVITNIKGNIATGYIVNDDFTQTKTCVAKNEEYFAHGKTLKEALQALEEKVIANLDSDEIIEMFLNEIDIAKSYLAQYFLDWHGKLTGSCKQGRESFIKNKNIDLNSNMTVLEFIEICKDDYGKDVILQLKERLTK